MVSSGGPKFSNSLSVRELEAQQLACSYLVKGCERALYQFGLVAGETGNVESASIDQRAAEIMRDVLGSWQETLSLISVSPPFTSERLVPEHWLVTKSVGNETAIGERAFD
jgi:hypothetical protein